RLRALPNNQIRHSRQRQIQVSPPPASQAQPRAFQKLRAPQGEEDRAALLFRARLFRGRL
ncbi:MAG: hypothetical protein Q8P67_21320, partial [archaeon]|nr:hypothetical protein [archaeon]